MKMEFIIKMDSFYNKSLILVFNVKHVVRYWKLIQNYFGKKLKKVLQNLKKLKCV